MSQRRLLAIIFGMMFCLFGSAIMLCQSDSAEGYYEGQPIYKIGHGVTAPRSTYAPNPEYDDKDRRKKINGTVELALIVTKDGRAADVKVTKSLTSGLDVQAIKAVSQWRFDPATKDGEPVATRINAQVSFRLY